MNAAINPVKPVTFHLDPGANLSKALTALVWALRPMTNSLTIMGIAKRKAQSRYIRMKAAPPFSPII